MSRPGRGVGSTVRPAARYFDASATPLASLIVVLPLVVFYELGTHLFASDPVRQTETRIVAYTKLREALESVHVTAAWMPAGVVIAVLASQWAFSRQRSGVTAVTILAMTLESVFLAFPVLGLAALVRAYLLAGQSVGEGVVLSVGAGVYEELLFRLLGVTLVHLLLADVLKIPRRLATATAIVVTAIGFSLYHYWGIESYTPQSFVFRGLAGAYFGVVFVYRGFGITVMCHTAYDIAVLGLAGRLSVAA